METGEQKLMHASPSSPNYDPLEIETESASTRANKTVCLKLSLVVMSILAIILLLALMVVKNSAGNSDTSGGELASNHEVCVSPECVTVAAHIISTLNQSVDPCQDFWQYSCGGWLSTHPVPDDKMSYNTFSVLAEQNDEVIKNLLGEPNHPADAACVGSAKKLYYLCMDTTAVDAVGGTPLKSVLAGPEWKVTDPKSLTALIAKMHSEGLSPLFNPYVGQDDKNSSRNVMFLGQSGLTLPDQSYYTKNSTNDTVLLAFKQYIQASFTLIGQPDSAQIAEDIVRFETLLANITVPKSDLRDPGKTYNPLNVSTMVDQAAQTILWTDYWSALYPESPNAVQYVVVSTPSYFSALYTLLSSTNYTTIQSYLQWNRMYHDASYLSSDFTVASFKFRKALYGVEKDSERWKNCLAKVEGVYGFAVGKIFLSAKFGSRSRDIAKTLIGNIKTAFKSKLPSLSWMDAETRAKAADKADKIMEKIGYPDMIDNATALDSHYNGLSPPTDSFYGTMMTARQWEEKDNLNDLFKVPDRTKWSMDPQTVNAYYNPGYNEIVFPAGILQSPFFDASFPWSLNYGGIGVVMGHELTHGFDDQGAQYDADGNLKTWWSPSVTKNFETKTKCIEQEYGKYTIVGPEMTNYNVNGELTLGENIADNGGLAESFAAYQTFVNANGKEKVLPGLPTLTPDHLFFVGFAQVWCGATRPEYAKAGVLTDPHSPHEWRVRGTVSNSADFARVYKCPAGSPMNPVDKCIVW